ncbi:hypothetical protein [Paraburkholderia sp. CI3]|uniref:hypothetical protein n=1 Tax=Paraburkholderia sp. CI3 TaxID=2991060 RepID=UPI003D1DD46D
MAIRLSDQAWQEIEVSYRAGSTAKALARHFGISASSIFHRSSAERWRATPRAAATPTQAERIELAVSKLETILQRIVEVSV